MSAPTMEAAAVAVRHALNLLGDYLDSLGWESDDARAGLAWHNSATVTERRYWHHVARSAVPADAWEAYKAGEPRL